MGKELEVIDLTAVAKRRAVSAIESTHDEYHKRGGLLDTLAKGREQSRTLSQYIFGLAQFANEQEPKNPDKARALYLDMCAYAEAKYRTDHAVTSVSESLPVWRVYKSNILGGMRQGLPPTDFESEYDFRKAKKALKSPGGGMKRRGRSQPKLEQEINEWLEETTIGDSLKIHVARIIMSVEHLKRGSTKEVERVLAKAAAELSKHVD